MNQATFHSFLASEDLKKPEKANQQDIFKLRLDSNISLIQHLFFELYPKEEHLKDFRKLHKLLSDLFEKRPDHLRLLDLQRMAKGNWYQDQGLVGMQLYVDRFNNDLKGLEEKLPYMEELGVNLIHLMPVTTRPKGQNDGGYAVNSYTKVDPRYGTKADLLRLIKTMHNKQMFIMLDFVVNHTSDEFPWAKKAAAGSKKYQRYYYTYPDREIPDAFEKTLPEVFPQSAPGNFTYNEEMKQWVMTVFNNYQWDLNYSNPEVFMEMLRNLVALANMGVDIVRFDALAFLWKKLGTISQNLPEAHMVISLFRLCLQVIAPGVILLAEAIVAPTNIIKYFGQGIFKGNECELAYNATLMSLLWNSVATKKTLLLYKNLKNIPSKPREGAWLNYVRCHDDIGLGFDDKYIYEVGWDAREHRKFLLEYFTQKLEWSPSVGQVFMHNPRTGDGRITGSAASLLGLEKALKTKNEKLVDQAIDKIVMLHGIILAYGGIPMLYAGDELGMLNDYSYLNEEDKRDDSRWLNRPIHDWAAAESIYREGTIPNRVFMRLRHLIHTRREKQVLSDRHLPVLHEPNNSHVLVFERTDDKHGGILVLCNFDENDQAVDAGWITSLGYIRNSMYSDLISGEKSKLTSGLFSLKPSQICWLESL
jgi:amylosucrase